MQLSSQAPELLTQSKRKAGLHTDAFAELKANRKCQRQKHSMNISLLISAKLGFVEATMHTHSWAESRQAWLWWSTLQQLHQILQIHIYTVVPGVTHIPTTTSSWSPSSLEPFLFWSFSSLFCLTQSLNWLSGATFLLMLPGYSSTWRAVVTWVQG